MRVGYIIGSLSADSINRRLVTALAGLAPEIGVDLTFDEIGIDRLAVYDRDADEDYPPEATELKRRIRDVDGILISTPEYNRTIPAALKNALEWGSRPYGDNAFEGKPVGIIGASAGASGTAMAQQHLRNVLAYLDAPALGQPEAFIHYTDERFADDGTIVDDSTREFLGDWLRAFARWIDTLTRAEPPR